MDIKRHIRFFLLSLLYSLSICKINAYDRVIIYFSFKKGYPWLLQTTDRKQRIECDHFVYINGTYMPGTLGRCSFHIEYDRIIQLKSLCLIGSFLTASVSLALMGDMWYRKCS